MNDKHYPEPIVGGFIFNPKGELFLFKTHKWNNLYCVPGGHIELGETIEQALKREMKEETGLIISDISLFAVFDCIFDEGYWKKKHFIFLNHIGKTTTIKVLLNDEAEEYVWVKPEDALKLPLEKFTRKTIEKNIAKKK